MTHTAATSNAPRPLSSIARLMASRVAKRRADLRLQLFARATDLEVIHLLQTLLVVQGDLEATRAKIAHSKFQLSLAAVDQAMADNREQVSILREEYDIREKKSRESGWGDAWAELSKDVRTKWLGAKI